MIDHDTPPGWLFWTGLALGGGVMAYGIDGLLRTHAIPPLALGAWIVGLAIIHDVFLAPTESLVGTGISRRTRRASRGPVVAAFIVAESLIIYALPLMITSGRQADNPSLLPGNYPLALGVLLALITVATAVAIRFRRDR